MSALRLRLQTTLLRCGLSLLCLGASAISAEAQQTAMRTQASGYVLSGMPLVRQTYNACGPASIVQVLGYYGLRMELSEVSRLTRLSETSYMTAQAIPAFAPLVGMEARLYRDGSLNTVRAAIRHGVPLIALQSHITPDGQVIPHWRVIVGYDDVQHLVYLMDPLLGYVTINFNDFSRVWADQRGQFAVLYPPQLSAVIQRQLG